VAGRGSVTIRISVGLLVVVSTYLARLALCHLRHTIDEPAPIVGVLSLELLRELSDNLAVTKKTHSRLFFERFPYACPEPVLVERPF
jgi:hypothetical protein